MSKEEPRAGDWFKIGGCVDLGNGDKPQEPADPHEAITFEATMCDTIGAHLANAHRASVNVSTCIHLAGEATTHESVEFYALKRAKWEGTAAGHAFRAAELAYDVGQAHGSTVTANAVYRGLGWPNRITVSGETSVHWSGEE